MATVNYALPDTYFELVQAFPLTSIQNEEHLAEAQKFLDNLLTQSLDEGGFAYLDALSDLIEVYEDASVPVSESPPEDVLRELIASSNLTQQALSKAVGIAQSTISDVLNGKRKLTTDHIARLAKHFNIPASVFMGS